MLNENLLCYFLLAIPFIVFYELFKKHFEEKSLRRSFFVGAVFGIITVLFVNGAYTCIGIMLGKDLKSFISETKTWWFLLLINISVVGFIEELFKSFGSSAAGLFSDKSNGVSITFMNYAGCALGFALMENLQYLGHFGSAIIFSRVFVSSLAHLFFSCVCSHVAILSHIRSVRFYSPIPKNEGLESSSVRNAAASLFVAIGTMIGVVLAACMHGAFNFFIFYFNIQAYNGLLLAVLSVFILIIYGYWITALRWDLAGYMFISSCPKCGSVGFLPFKFCPSCGSRVKILRKFTFVAQGEKTLPNEQSNERQNE